jgi:hypothetical protein
MSDPFDMAGIDQAREFLSVFDSATRQKGENYFRHGRVKEITPGKNAKPGTHYIAIVEGSNIYGVDLTYSKPGGWMGHCSCPVGNECKHIYAGMKALLAEQSLAAVRQISSNAMENVAPPGPNSPTATPPAKPRERVIQPVSTLAANALGRPLDRRESAFCRKLTEVYQRCAMLQHVSRWDFDDLGLPLGGYSWEPLKLWPNFPRTEHEFWLHLACAAEEHQVPIPEFLEPVTDITALKESLRQWRRSLEIDRWKDLLGNAGNREANEVSRGQFDLRLMILKDRAQLEWKRPGWTDFETVKTAPFRQFVDDYRNGRATIGPEVEILCQLIAGRLLYTSSLDLRFAESEALALVGQILRTRSLENSVVSSNGLPMRREEDRLRWVVTPEPDENGDYQAWLARGDGNPLTGLLCAIPGRPALYVTETSVFTGPGFQNSLLDPLQINKIPSPALETIDGIQFLKAFGMEMPPRIRDRICTVPMEVTIRCEIKPLAPGSTSEDCVFTVTAMAQDGSRTESWDGHAWLVRNKVNLTLDDDYEEDLNPKTTPTPKPDVLPVYDRSVMQSIPILMEPLALKISHSGKPALRITRKFADVFVPWVQSVPPHVNLRLKGELKSFQNATVSGRVRLDVKETEIDWFDLRVVLDVSDTTLTPQEIKLLLNAKGGFVRLADKGWRRLEFDLSQEEDEKLASLGLSPRELTGEPQRLHALQLADAAARQFLPEEQAESVQRRAAEIKARVSPPLPAGVLAGLRPYQLEGFHFLAYLSTNRFGGILADDMGLGKTLQTLAWLLWIREQQGSKAKPALVVCPKSVMENWRAEAERFTPAIRVRIWRPGEYETLATELNTADLHVINYSQLRMAGPGFHKINWLAVILDEGQ